jgi:ribosome-binding protein aMBF1 (putative translation factor)
MDNKQPALTGDPLNAVVMRALRNAQHDAKMSDVALAQKVDVKVQTLRRWMDDERAMPASPFLRIAAALGVNVSALLDSAQAQISK